MKKFCYILIPLFFSWSAQAQQMIAQEFSKKGAFSFTPLLGMETASYTNESGLHAAYSGMSYGARLTLRPMPDGSPAFSIFAEYLAAQGENSDFATEENEVRATHFGFTQHLFYFLYLGAAIGERNIKFKQPTQNLSIEVDAKVAGLGLGFDVISIGESWTISLEAWQYYGYSVKGANDTHNRGLSSTEYFLGVRWSPAVKFSTR